MILTWMALLNALAGVTLALAGIAAAHYGITPRPFIGFEIFAVGLLFATLGLLVAIIGGIVSLFSPTVRGARGRLISGALLALVVVVPVVVIFVTHPYPPINDITTDTKNPPEFVHAQEEPANQKRDMKYDAAKYAAVQEGAPMYKDLAPLKTDATPDDAYNHARIIAGEIKDWRLTYNDPQTRTTEGVATSMLFRFKDDFVIQVRPADGGGSLIEMRSKSRDGIGDFGVNYVRIKRFLKLVQGPPRGAPEQH
jgi:uncharacterized protein (DUF1499 family)